MADVLVRDVPEEVLAVLDARAARLGLSRSEYVRRRLAQEAALLPGAVSVDDLASFADRFADLKDPDIMSGAWG
jgi:plasmid stability protein